MTIRVRVTAALVVLTVLGVVAATALVLQRAVEDKRSYATELNSVLAPQIRSEADSKFSVLQNHLLDITAVAHSKSQEAIAEKLANFRAMPGVDAIFFNNSSGHFIFVQLNEGSQSAAAAKKFIEKIDMKALPEIESGKFSFIDSGIFIYKTQDSPLVGVVLSPPFLGSSFDLSRGKDSFLLNFKGQIIFEGQIGTSPQSFEVPDLRNSGADILATEVKWNGKAVKSVYFSKLSAVKDVYVMIAAEKITWLDLAGPILNSSVSLVAVLVLASILLAFSISGSIARPIERITDETAKVGLGDWNAITVDSSAGEVERLAVAFNNMIGNLKKREGELKIANTKLVRSESLAAVGRIGAGIAHEVKNPLASILSYGQLLEMNIKTAEKTAAPESTEKLEKIKNYNKMIMDDTRRASKIISDLLTFARQKDVQTSKIAVKDFLTEVEGKLKAFCEMANIKFESNLGGITNDTVAELDSDQIYQVLFNLVQNATHALKELEGEKLIQLAASQGDHKLSISVKDNGNGIAEEHLSKIFEPFFSTKGIGEGSGLGLAICYGIVQKHSGQITVNSTLGSGTIFEMTFPTVS